MCQCKSRGSPLKESPFRRRRSCAARRRTIWMQANQVPVYDKRNRLIRSDLGRDDTSCTWPLLSGKLLISQKKGPSRTARREVAGARRRWPLPEQKPHVCNMGMSENRDPRNRVLFLRCPFRPAHKRKTSMWIFKLSRHYCSGMLLHYAIGRSGVPLDEESQP